MIKEMMSETFAEEVLEASQPVVVEFYTPICHFCKRFEPILAAVAEKYEDTVKVYRVNAAENRELAMQYSIFGVPTTIIFNAGREIERISGLVPQAELEKKLENVVQ